MIKNTNAILGWGAAGVMIAAIIGGLMLIGSPGEARAKKEDGVRLQAMQKTAKAISCYSDNIGALPDDLATIKAAFDDKNSKLWDSNRCRNLIWATDPVSKDEFEYIRVKEAEFQLCAVFAAKREKGERSPGYEYYVNINDVLVETDQPRPAAGRHCFTGHNWKKDANF